MAEHQVRLGTRWWGVDWQGTPWEGVVRLRPGCGAREPLDPLSPGPASGSVGQAGGGGSLSTRWEGGVGLSSLRRSGDLNNTSSSSCFLSSRTDSE